MPAAFDAIEKYMAPDRPRLIGSPVYVEHPGFVWKRHVDIALVTSGERLVLALGRGETIRWWWLDDFEGFGLGTWGTLYTLTVVHKEEGRIRIHFRRPQEPRSIAEAVFPNART